MARLGHAGWHCQATFPKFCGFLTIAFSDGPSWEYVNFINFASLLVQDQLVGLVACSHRNIFFIFIYFLQRADVHWLTHSTPIQTTGTHTATLDLKVQKYQTYFYFYFFAVHQCVSIAPCTLNTLQTPSVGLSFVQCECDIHSPSLHITGTMIAWDDQVISAKQYQIDNRW